MRGAQGAAGLRQLVVCTGGLYRFGSVGAQQVLRSGRPELVLRLPVSDDEPELVK